MGVVIPQVITPSRATGAQVIDDSLKINQTFTQHLSKTFGSSGNRKTITWSAWVRRGKVSSEANLFSVGNSSTDAAFRFNDNDTLQVRDGNGGELTTQAVFRDTGWYHIVVKIDTTQSTAADRFRLYVNGSETVYSATSYASQDANIDWNDAVNHYIGRQVHNTSNLYDGAICQVYFIDGQALGPEYFGYTDPLTNTWKPKKYTGVFNAPISGLGGTVWSSLVSNGSSGSTAPSKAFNGDIANNSGYDESNWTRSASNGDTPAVFDVTSVALMADVTEVKVYVYVLDSGNDNTLLAVNDSNVTTGGSSGFQVYTVDVTGNGLDTIKYKYKNGSGPYCYLTGVTVSINGGAHQELIDGSGAAAGANGFWLPFDGNSPIGQDQSGNGNNWTPINFNASVALDNPQVSGARPILNTIQGGTQAGVGVFGSKENKYYTVTTANGSVYQFDITSGDNPSLEFIRGATYRFDYSSHTGHPVLFSSTNPDSSTTAYTTGTSIASNVISFTVPHDAPDTLYYYCSAHPTSMNGSISVTTDETKADLYASNCVLAVPFISGVSDDVSPSIACTSTTKSLTKQGDPTSTTTSSNFYSSSTDFDGTGDYYKSASESDFAFGTGDFTIEYWIDSDDLAGNQYGHLQISSSSTGLQENYTAGLAIYESPIVGAIAVPGLTDISIPSTGRLIKAGVWNHIALVREGTNARLYINGFLADSSTDSKDITGTYLGIGGYYNTNYVYNGRLQDLRIYKGVAKYNDSFVVPATSPDVLPDTPSGVSGGSKLAKITDGAVSFDGTGDYLSVADSDDFDLGTGDFTFEAFFNQTLSYTNYRYIFSHYDGSNGHWLRTDGDGPGRVQFGSGGTVYITSTTNVALNKWHHVAVVRVGTTVTLYLDGKSEGTYTLSGDITSTGEFRIGRQGSSTTHYFGGFISNVRINKGTALYTSRFTPPTEPLTNVTNTKLLCCQSNTSAEAAAVQPSVTSYYTGGTALTWASNPIGSKWSLSNSNKNATSSGGSGYTGADVFSVALAANTTYAWTLDITNGDSTGGWYFADVQSNTGTHADQKGGNSLGLRGGETSAGYYGTFASANSGSDGQDKITMNSDVSPNGAKSIDFVVYRPSSGTGKVWVKANTATTWIGGGDPSNTSSTATFIIPDGTTYFGFIDYDSGDTTTCNMRGDGDVTSPPLLANGDASATNFNPFNTDIHTVRGQETGYATLNPLYPNPNGNSPTDGNLKQTTTSGNGQYNATMAIPQTGSWYWEVTKEGTDSTGIIGISNPVLSRPEYNANNVGSFSWYIAGPRKQTNGVDSDYGGSVAQGDVVGVAYKSDIRELRFYLNGVDQGVAFDASSIGVAEYFPAFSAGSSSNTFTFSVNFGQKPFKYAPPDGFQPINAANVRPETVISRPDQYVGVTTYTGSAPTAQQITGLNFGTKPDFVWVKNYSDATGYFHGLFDTVRGANEVLASNDTMVQGTTTQQLMSFDHNGFTVGTNSDSQNYVNLDADDYVAWCWKAGGDKDTFNVDDVGYASAAAAGLTAGTLTISGASVGTKQGFSIIKYAGSGSNSTFPHGLTQAPDFYMIKCLDVGAESWRVYHSSVGATKALTLNTSAEASTSNIYFNDTEPTSTVASVYAGYDGVNNTGRNYISYLWHNVPGLQKFGTYEGLGGTANGSFVELGFRPAIVWVKNIDTASQTNTHWCVFDRLRPGFNKSPAQNRLHLDTNDQEDPDRVDDGQGIDILSNGFRVRSNNWYETNLSGATYIYCAWAETPTVDLYGGGANAR